MMDNSRIFDPSEHYYCFVIWTYTAENLESVKIKRKPENEPVKYLPHGETLKLGPCLPEQDAQTF